VSGLIDLSHVVSHGMVTYPGLPGPVIGDHLSRPASQARYAPGTEFQIGKIEMIANTGTYVDAPWHRYADGGNPCPCAASAYAFHELDSVIMTPHISSCTEETAEARRRGIAFNIDYLDGDAPLRNEVLYAA